LQVRVHVTLKPGVLDPQGKAIEHALLALGFAGLLANTVIENYAIELDA
jgi:phosphoribosylformylglycinamidine synthase